MQLKEFYKVEFPKYSGSLLTIANLLLLPTMAVFLKNNSWFSNLPEVYTLYINM